MHNRTQAQQAGPNLLSNSIAIPIKDLATAKTRLSVVLTSAERAEFAASMFQDVITAAKQTADIQHILVVTPEGPAATRARENRTELLLESHTDGLNRAVQIATSHAQTRGTVRLLILHADLPTIQPQDLSIFFQTNSKIMMSPSRDLDGTNALLLSPPNILKPRYGRRSFDTHTAMAREVGIEPVVVKNDRLGLDIDTPEDLLHLCELKPRGYSGRFLKKYGIEERLQAKGAESLWTNENQAAVH